MSDIYLFRSSYGSYRLVLRVSTKYLRILIGLTEFILTSETIPLDFQTYQSVVIVSEMFDKWQKYRLAV